ncbi:MAG: hypothetical protein OHK0041_21640 [Anaerolineales bacterium]
MTQENLTPRDSETANELERLAASIHPNPVFQSELEEKLKAAHKPKGGAARQVLRNFLPAFGWTAALAALAILMNLAIRSIAPQPQPATGNTPAPTLGILLPEDTPTPSGKAYERYGQPLYLQAELPAAPTEASLYTYQPEQSATLESARALALQFGMNGAVYRVPGETASPYDRDFLIVDGEQWLHVRSDQYFQYYPDYPRFVSLVNGAQPPANAEALIEDFLQSHGFDFPHRIQTSEVYGGYLAAPLTPDGHILCYEHFKCAGLHFQLDEQGILYVDGILPKYAPLGQYAIISAEEAFQTILESNGDAGMMEGMTSFSPPIQTWVRARPLDTTLTFYGYLGSVPSAEGGAPLVTLDGIRVTGNTENVPPEYGNTFVEATGQFHEENGVKTFALETWKIYDGYEDGLLGAISQQNGQVILNTPENEIFVLPDVPADLPLPLDNAFVIGVRQGDTFEWKSIDLRNVQGGGGGGGGGLGFYKLNLTGTPVPFSTPAPQTFGGGGGSGGQTYVVSAGDTCRGIASAFHVAVEELMAVNNLPADCSTLTIGQTLLIPESASYTPQKVDGLRGTLSITIYKQKDGSQRVEYNLLNKDTPFPLLPLEGENLEPLQAWQNKPVDVWGTVETNEAGQPALKVERYEIPFPDLQFQILRGTQTPVTLDGQQVTLFTAADGQTYAQLTPDGFYPDGSTVGNLDDEVMIEALLVPGETFGSYPAARIFSAATTGINPKTGQEAEPLSVTADQIYTVDLASDEYTPPTMTIERVELVYYMPDPRYIQGELEPDQRTIQPAWLFTGHYSTGETFFILVQALKQEFLLPEIAPYTQPG